MDSSSLLKGWVKTAQDEFSVYEIIKKSEPDYRVLFRQKYNALCQSIELTLKAFLILNGHSVKEVKNVGHDLIKLFDIAYIKHGLTIPPGVYKKIEVINSQYKSRKFLYFEEQYVLPTNIDSIETVTRLLISKVMFVSGKESNR